MIPFGWSAGDLVNGINVIVRVAEAFKETGGAASKYQAHHDFAVGLKKTFASLKLYTDLHEHDGYSDDIAGQLKLIEKPWKRFQTFLEKYDEPLGAQSTMYKLKKAPRIVKWTAKDLSGEVEKLERAVHRPLESLNLLLSLAAFAGSSAAVISQQPRSTSKSPRQYQHFADFEGSDVRFDGSESNVPTSTAAPWRKKSRDLPAHSQGNPDSSDDDPRDSSPPSRLSARNQVRELKSEDEEDSSGNDSDDPDSGDASAEATTYAEPP
ncbi:uncharacterized protein K441DRAFT_682774 [Cenococcum geophilum 1.58]|uniref:Uncharacterized protein n=1 Tax=Cenococcum geophilum 1.58 TaxID=794803 RepID=A0ACC8EM48_9PEZI|nr:hypothetical protein K441DRAFT_682774 [Cenococcum geophilum 1.58]